MELVLVRHGIAEDQDQAGGDAQRSLTDQGMQLTEEVARGLTRVTNPPEAILHSPKLRAKQTAELLGSAFSVQPQPLEILADGDAQQIRPTLAQRQERRLLIVGHEPTFSQLIRLLLTDRTPAESGIKLHKAGLAMVEVAFAHGQQAAPAKLHWLFPPDALRQLA